MNRAEYIIATVNTAVAEDTITRKDVNRVLGTVASMLNSGIPAAELDGFLHPLWTEVGHKWGGRKPHG